MHIINVHFKLEEGWCDEAVKLEIRMPYVPRVGDTIFLDPTEYEHLEKKVQESEHLKKLYKRWMYGAEDNRYCSFDDAQEVRSVTYVANRKGIHIELDG